MDWEKTFANRLFDKGINIQTHTTREQKKKQNNLIKIWVKDRTDIFPRRQTNGT